MKCCEEQADNLVRGERISTSVHAPDPVRVAISDEAQIVRMLPQVSGAKRVVSGNRLGVDPAEQAIMASVERCDFACRPGQQVIETSSSHAEQSVMRKPQA